MSATVRYTRGGVPPAAGVYLCAIPLPGGFVDDCVCNFDGRQWHSVFSDSIIASDVLGWIGPIERFGKIDAYNSPQLPADDLYDV